MVLPIHIQDQNFILHCSGAIFWEEKSLLLIADVHLGKVMHFRKAGFAVPSDAILKNFLQLTAAVDYFKPGAICFLGDLFHSTINNEWDLFADWFGKCGCKVILVAGNHDIIVPKKYLDINIQVVSEWTIGNFLLTHHPQENAEFFNFCGHIHPCVRLQGKGRQFLKLPCFFKRPNQLILPAFGEFTGTYELAPTEGDIVYAITKEEVILVAKN
jgi:DNA ligase-associated metallophosphoesterase